MLHTFPTTFCIKYGYTSVQAQIRIEKKMTKNFFLYIFHLFWVFFFLNRHIYIYLSFHQNIKKKKKMTSIFYRNIKQKTQLNQWRLWDEINNKLYNKYNNEKKMASTYWMKVYRSKIYILSFQSSLLKEDLRVFNILN